MQRMLAIPARVRAMDPQRFDIALTALFILAALLETALIHHKHGTRGVTAVFAVAGLLPMAWRRRNTLAVAIAFGAVALASEAFDTFYTRDLTSPFIAMLVLTYTAARYTAGRRMWATIGILVV